MTAVFNFPQRVCKDDHAKFVFRYVRRKCVVCLTPKQQGGVRTSFCTAGLRHRRCAANKAINHVKPGHTAITAAGALPVTWLV
jgi:hypothetical protein